jgi:hypothetical protein
MKSSSFLVNQPSRNLGRALESVIRSTSLIAFSIKPHTRYNFLDDLAEYKLHL